MQAVHSPQHARHDPLVEVQQGVPVPALERAARADTILGALDQDAAFQVRPPVEHGVEPILAVHDADLVRFLERAWSLSREEGWTGDLVPDTFLVSGLREGMGPAGSPDT